MSVGDDEADVGRNGPDVGHVIVDPFELQQNRARHQSGWRHFNFGRPLDRLAESRRVGKTGIAGNAFRQEHGLMNRQALKKLLGPLVRIEHSQLQVEDRFPGHGEAEMPRLDDACVDRSYWHLQNAFTERGPVDMTFSLEARQGRHDALPISGIGMSHRS